MDHHVSSHSAHQKFIPVVFAALGVVFGDIGTSPLYAVNELFFGAHTLPQSPENILGCISLVIWAITTVISLKYVTLVLRASNGGEGGVFALYSLLHPFKKKGLRYFLLLLLLCAGLLFGDGMITPAISVLSAIEGVKILAPSLEHWIIPITLAILTLLFGIQRYGTAKVGALFGPVITLWFITLASLGMGYIFVSPSILAAFNPLYAIRFLLDNNMRTIVGVMGGVMLSITGGEALFADMGHFGLSPIRVSWFSLVYPALLINYLGQGAFLLSHQQIIANNIFYSMVPQLLLFPIVLLATFATIIASQALISGAFSLTSQAVALGVFPRLKIVHTHHHHEGQIYVPFVNWSLWLGCILLVICFQSSANLASAYGLAVAGDMTTTSIAMIFVALFCWGWSSSLSLLVFLPFLVIDFGFLTANASKLLEGGFVPLTIGFILFIIMTSWMWERKATFRAYTSIHTLTIKELCMLKRQQTNQIDKNIIFMVPRHLHDNHQNSPALLQIFWNRFRIFPRNILFVEVTQTKSAYIEENRYQITTFDRCEAGSVSAVRIRFGFMEDPNVEKVLEGLALHNEIALSPDPKEWVVQGSIEHLIPSDSLSFFRKMQLSLFVLLRKVTLRGYYYFGLGDEVQLSLEVLPVKI